MLASMILTQLILTKTAARFAVPGPRMSPMPTSRANISNHFRPSQRVPAPAALPVRKPEPGLLNVYTPPTFEMAAPKPSPVQRVLGDQPLQQQLEQLRKNPIVFR